MKFLKLLGAGVLVGCLYNKYKSQKKPTYQAESDNTENNADSKNEKPTQNSNI